jgi:hypothetical protein
MKASTRVRPDPEDEVPPAPRVVVVKQISRKVLDPRKSRFVRRWELPLTLAVFFTALITPYEVGFLEQSSQIDVLFVMNRIMDCIFAVDLVLQFFMMFRVQSGMMRAERWVSDHGAIIRHYLYGWFLLDFLALMVGVFDVYAYSIIASEEQQQGGGAHELQRASSTKLVRVLLRLLRATRLLKMLRLMNMRRLVRRWEEFIGETVSVSFSTLKLVKCVVGVAAVCHWFACLWGLVASFQTSRLSSWMGAFGYCVPLPHDASSPPPVLGAGGEDEDGAQCIEPFALYLAAFYWAVMTITSIGYGDIAASNAPEQAVCALMMLFGGIFWALVIGELCAVISAMNAESSEFNRRIDEVNSLIRQYSLRPEMALRLREYFHATKHLRTADTHRQLLQSMSPALQSEVMWEMHRPWLERVHFLRAAPRRFMVELAVALEAVVLAPGEVSPLGYLYVVLSGVVLYGGRVLTAGKVWGMDSILANEGLRSAACGRTMTYVAAYRVSGELLLELASHFPSMHKHMRWHAVKLALHRYIVRHAVESQSAQTAEEAASEAAADHADKVPRVKRFNSKLLASLDRASMGDDSNSVGDAKRDRSPPGRGRQTLALSPNSHPASASELAACRSLVTQQGETIEALRREQGELAVNVAEMKDMLRRLLERQQQ